MNKTKQTNPMKLYWNNSHLKVKWRNPRKREAKSNYWKDREFTIHQTSQGTKPSINPFYEFGEVFKIILQSLLRIHARTCFRWFVANFEMTISITKLLRMIGHKATKKYISTTKKIVRKLPGIAGIKNVNECWRFCCWRWCCFFHSFRWRGIDLRPCYAKRLK